MYLDPGSVGMFIQGLFALVAAVLTAFRIPAKLIAAARALRSRK